MKEGGKKKKKKKKEKGSRMGGEKHLMKNKTAIL